MQFFQNESLSRLLQKAPEGAMLLGAHGDIKYINDTAREMLRIGDGSLPKLADWLSDIRNEEFVEHFVKSVYEQTEPHRDVLKFYASPQDKQPVIIDMAVSFIYDESGAEKEGILALMKDITQQELLKLERREASFIMIALICFIAVNVLIWEFIVWRGYSFSPSSMTKLIEVLGFALALLLLSKTTQLRQSLVRIVPRARDIAFALLFSAGLPCVIAAVKAVLCYIGVYPWESYIDLTGISLMYFFTALIQELLARSVMQECFSVMLWGRHRAALSIVCSSLTFGVMHLAYGFPLMAFAMLLIAMLGGYYNKTKSVVAVAIIHYVLGTAVNVFGFV